MANNNNKDFRTDVLVDLVSYTNDFEEQIIDMDWDGHDVDHLYQQLDGLKERIKNGELYEPLF